VRTPPKDKELPKQPAKEVTPPEKPQTPDHGAVGKEQPAGQDAQPQKVKIPKPPIAVHEPVGNKELKPPPKPEHPKPDPNAKPKPSKADTPDRSKDNDSSDKDKPEPAKK
jgi:protein TonB